MVRRMKATITQIASVVTLLGNSGGHVVVPKAWIGKETIVKLKEKDTRGTNCWTYKNKNSPTNHTSNTNHNNVNKAQGPH
jgi:putative transposon-encoded protein